MPSKSVPPLPGTTPPTICVPYSLHARVWSCPTAPVIPCVSTRVFLSTKILICGIQAPISFTMRLAASAMSAGGNHLDARVGENLLALDDVGAFHPDHQRHVELHLFRRLDDALREHVASHDAAEDVDEHAFDAFVREQDAKRRGDFLCARAAADVESSE